MFGSRKGRGRILQTTELGHKGAVFLEGERDRKIGGEGEVKRQSDDVNSSRKKIIKSFELFHQQKR